MPLYELSLIVRVLPKPQLINTTKNAIDHVYDAGGLVRSLSFLGDRLLPQKQVRKKVETEDTRGNYFLVQCDLPAQNTGDVLGNISRDPNILRKTLFSVGPAAKPPEKCTLDEEFLSPSRRPSVQELIAQGQGKNAWKLPWSDRTGLDFTPFHR